MLNKKKGKHRRQQEAAADKRFRYSIRKFNVGVASVAIAAFMFLKLSIKIANIIANIAAMAIPSKPSEIVTIECIISTSKSLGEKNR